MRFLTGATVLGALALLAAGSASGAEGNAEAGKKVFNKCATCHGIGDKKGAVGPSLNGVVGRTAGTLEDYKSKYSKPMVAAGAAGLVWSEAELAAWVADPKKKVPGTKMVFPGLKKEQEIADVVAYVKSFSP
ncbi:c-type cytochrome [Aureimonas glaciei]|uniref:Cytochrome C protein n=1 Tax=Aureimonas glaciei TaxID=1776957 RepID=A0A916XWL3_9HYPH|nr:cytochrome c family protein [Aureimonas glaciei]GGD17138.1 cytochrome C protein [Aureimonas glaciei]